MNGWPMPRHAMDVYAGMEAIPSGRRTVRSLRSEARAAAEIELAEAETEVPCAGCGRELRGPGILCAVCRRNRQPALDEAA